MPVHDWTKVNAGIFHSFHTTWLANLATRLNELLPSDYYALPEAKALGYEPDILTLGRAANRNRETAPRNSRAANGNSLVATRPANVTHRVSYSIRRPSSRNQRSVVVRQSDDDRIVAIIEVVSPGNKSSGHSIDAFVGKINKFVANGINALVVDLFPPTRFCPDGIHVAIWGEAARTESPLPPDKPLVLAAFAVSDDEQAFVQPIAIGDSMPEMPLYLEPDLYVEVPLEQTYSATFNGFPQRWREVLEAQSEKIDN